MEHSIWPDLDKLVECFVQFICREGNRLALHDKFFLARSVSRDAAAIHRAGLLFTSILEPYIRPGRATRIKQPKVFETVRHESDYFNEFVVIVRRIAL